MMKHSQIRTSPVLLALAAATLAATLSGCVPFVIGAAAVGGAGLVATDRRTTGTQIEDESIERRAGSAISSNFGDRVHVNVNSYNRQVLLTGEAPTQQDKERIEQYVARVENVRGVVNDIGIMPPTGFRERSSDTFITSKVRASFVDAKDIYANAFLVTTERGVVYLMGRVTQREATRTAEIARGVSGVLKVVRVYELISEDELANVGRQQPPAPSLPAGGAAPAAPAPALAAPAQPAGVVVTPIR
jgi:osmotically-inducible protein OsmY